jgi:hypothetical protein
VGIGAIVRLSHCVQSTRCSRTALFSTADGLTLSCLRRYRSRSGVTRSEKGEG